MSTHWVSKRWHVNGTTGVAVFNIRGLTIHRATILPGIPNS